MQGAGVEETAMHKAVCRSAKLVSKPREEAVRRRPHVEGSRSRVGELISMGKEREGTSRRDVEIGWANYHGGLREIQPSWGRDVRKEKGMEMGWQGTVWDVASKPGG